MFQKGGGGGVALARIGHGLNIIDRRLSLLSRSAFTISVETENGDDLPEPVFVNV